MLNSSVDNNISDSLLEKINALVESNKDSKRVAEKLQMIKELREHEKNELANLTYVSP